MFLEERKNQIIDFLQNHHRVTVNQLTALLKVSEATVRRDLQDLEQQGALKRTRGGAILHQSSNVEPPYTQKEATAFEEKKYIGRLAANFINDGDTIILDAGTTTAQLIPYITQKELTIITNSVCAIPPLSTNPDINLIVAGGYSRYHSRALVGEWALTMLKQFHASKLFLGVDGIDLAYGYTTNSLEEAPLKRQMLQRTDEVFILADSSKFNLVTLNKIAELEDIDHIISDDKLPSDLAEKYISRGVNIINQM